MTLKKFDYTDTLGRSKSVMTLKNLMDDMLHLVGILKVELKFNLFSVSQMCDKKNSVLFTDTEYVVLSSDYKLPDENHVLLRVPRENNIIPSIGFMRPFGCPVTILNTLDPLGKFDGTADEGFLVGYFVNSKAFRGVDLNGCFDIDTLTQSMNYQPVVVGNQPNHNAGIKDNLDACKVGKETVSVQQYNENEVHVSPSGSDKTKKHDDKAKRDDKGKSHVDLSPVVRYLRDEFEEFSVNNTNRVNAASAPVTAAGPNPTNSTNSFNTASPSDTAVSLNFRIDRKSSFVDPSNYPDDPDMPALEDIVYSDYEEDVGAKVDLSNLETNIFVSPIPTTKVHKDHLVTQIIGDLTLSPETRKEPKRVHQALKDPSWIEAMQEELFQFKMQKVWVQVDLPKAKRVIGSKWVFRNKKDKRGIMIRNKAKLVAHGHTQEEGIDYDKVFAPVASQDKYVAGILKKFGFTYVKSASTPIETEKPLINDPDGKDVDVHIYRYLKGKPHLGLWYPKDSSFNLVAYSDSDYARGSLDRKSTTGGCQFL
nr:hypothetical protein [Tanacetum cinerariifolium]